MRRAGSKADPIVLVMDDGGRRASLQRTLDRAGYSCVVSTDGARALEVLGQVPAVPGAILLDANVQQPFLRALFTTLTTTPRFASVQIFVIQTLEDVTEELQ